MKLESHVGKKNTTYYVRITVDGDRKKINLGHDYAIALQKFREIENNGGLKFIKTLGQVWEHYSKTDLLKRSLMTQKGYSCAWRQIDKMFGKRNLQDIEPHHIRSYMDHRKAKSRANIEKALISVLYHHAFNQADIAYRGFNPCTGVKRNPSKGRRKYVEANEYLSIYKHADNDVKDLMDLCLYTGQRISDVLKMTFKDIIRNLDSKSVMLYNNQYASDVINIPTVDLLKIKTNKTDEKVNVILEGPLKETIDRITNKHKSYKIDSIFLLCDKNGQPWVYRTIYQRYEKARRLAGFTSYEIQVRDLRSKNACDSTLADANVRLAHTNIAMTERYRDKVKGKVVMPLGKLL